MLDEIPVIFEAQQFFEPGQVATGRVIYRFSDGRMYSGIMQDNKPEGYGIMLGPRWCYEGTWENGVFIRGTMINVGSGLQIRIPVVEVSERSFMT